MTPPTPSWSRAPRQWTFSGNPPHDLGAHHRTHELKLDRSVPQPPGCLEKDADTLAEGDLSYEQAPCDVPAPRLLIAFRRVEGGGADAEAFNHHSFGGDANRLELAGAKREGRVRGRQAQARSQYVRSPPERRAPGEDPAARRALSGSGSGTGVTVNEVEHAESAGIAQHLERPRGRRVEGDHGVEPSPATLRETARSKRFFESYKSHDASQYPCGMRIERTCRAWEIWATGEENPSTYDDCLLEEAASRAHVTSEAPHPASSNHYPHPRIR
jgi:hypothetical protein